MIAAATPDELDEAAIEANHRAVQTTFVVGAGVSGGSWEPVRRALLRHLERLGKANASVARGTENFLFAQHIHQRRFYSLPPEHPSFAKDPDKRERYLNGARAHAELDRQLRLDINEELTKAQQDGSINLDRRFVAALKLDWVGITFALTANWDHLLEKEGAPSHAVLHIHGDGGNPARLYLPSEETEEPYRVEGDDLDHMRKVMGSTWTLVSAAKTVWLYGIGLSPLDAELAMLFHVGLEDHKLQMPKRIIISAPRCSLGDIEAKVRLLVEMSGKLAAIDLDPVDEQWVDRVQPTP